MVMELPYLKKKKNQGGGGPIERTADQSSPDQLIEMVADELLDAIHKKDRGGLIHAIRALVMMIQDEDQEQDEEMLS